LPSTEEFVVMAGAGETAQAEAVRLAARTYAPDRYLAALLAPRAARGDLVALAAYLGEIGRVALNVNEPALGEMRLQWWRDSIGAAAAGQRTGNPVADALIEVGRRHDLPRDLLLAPIEGRSRELYEDGIADEEEFEDYLDETEGAPLRLSACVLGVPLQAVEDAAALSARVLGRARVALALPLHIAKGRLPLPRTRVPESDPRTLPEADARRAVSSATRVLINEARETERAAGEAVAAAPKAAFPAFLQLALLEPYLHALESRRRDPLLELADISPLTRASKLWLASVRGRI
jgi:phytoene synthase